MNEKEFRSELEKLINRYSMENGSNTPDFILADYLVGCLAAFDHATKTRDEWNGRGPRVAPRPPDEPDYDAPKPLTPLENHQRNDEHSPLL